MMREKKGRKMLTTENTLIVRILKKNCEISSRSKLVNWELISNELDDKNFHYIFI